MKVQGSRTDTILASTSRVWLQLVAVALVLLTSVHVSPAEFGEFALASSVSMFAAVLVGHGFYEYIIKGDHRDSSPATVLYLNLFHASILIGVLHLGAGAIDRAFDSSNIGVLLIWLAPVLLLQGIAAVLEPVLLRHGKLGYVSMSVIVAETIALIAAVTGLLQGYGVFSLVIHKWLREISHCAILFAGRRWQPRIAFDFDVAIAAWRFASGIICSRTGTNVILYGTELIIGLILSPAAAGLYRLANRIVSSVSEVVLYALRMILWVRLPAVQDDEQAFSGEVISAYEMAGVAYFALLGGIASIAWLAFAIFFAPEWQPAVPAIVILAASRLIGFPVYIVEPIMALRDRTDLLFWFNTITGIVSLGTLLIIGRYGLVWAAASQVVAAFVWAGLALNILTKLKAAPLDFLLSLPCRLAVAAAAMVIAVLSFEYAGAAAGLSHELLLTASILVGAVTYGASVLLLTPRPAWKYADLLFDASRKVLRRAS